MIYNIFSSFYIFFEIIYKFTYKITHLAFIITTSIQLTFLFLPNPTYLSNKNLYTQYYTMLWESVSYQSPYLQYIKPNIYTHYIEHHYLICNTFPPKQPDIYQMVFVFTCYYSPPYKRISRKLVISHIPRTSSDPPTLSQHLPTFSKLRLRIHTYIYNFTR